MAARSIDRSIASLSLTLGLVSIPDRLHSTTESPSAIRFKRWATAGRLQQQCVTDEPVPAESSRAEEPGPAVVARADMVKGYKYEKDKFVLFGADELKALEEGSRHTIDIEAFIPERAVDPLHYDKAYFLAPDQRGAKPCRSADNAMVLQQLLYADEVRSLADLNVELVDVSDAERARRATDGADIRAVLQPRCLRRRREATDPGGGRAKDRRAGHRRAASSTPARR